MTIRQKLTDAYIFVMLLAFPLFPGFHGYARITDAKFFFFSAATLLWLASLVVFSCFDRGAPALRQALRPPEIAALAFAAVCVLSALLSPFFPATLLGTGRRDGLVTLLLYVLVFLGARRFGRLRTAHLYAVGAALLLQAAVVLPQLLDKNPLGLFPGELRWSDAGERYSGAFLGTIGNVDLLADYLSLAIPLLFAAYVVRARHWPLLIPAAIGVLLLLCAGTAAGAVSLLLGALIAAPLLITGRERLKRGLVAAAAALLPVAVYGAVGFHGGGIVLQADGAGLPFLFAALLSAAAALLLHRRRACAVRPRKVYLAGILCAESLAILAALIALYHWPGETGTLHELRCVLHGQVDESFGSSRIRIWRETLALFPERPILGGGPGTLARRMQIEFERYVPETGVTLKSFVDNAHSVYLGFLADTGAAGLLAYLALILCSAIEVFKNRSDAVVLVIGAALLCGWIFDLFGLGLCLTAPILWLLWGLAGAKERRDAPAGSLRPAGSE